MEQKIKYLSFVLINSLLSEIKVINKIKLIFLKQTLIALQLFTYFFKKTALHYSSGSFHILECRVCSLHNVPSLDIVRASLDNVPSLLTHPIL